MQAVAISEPGAPDVLQTVTQPLPEPGPGEVLIRVAAAGVNRPDCLQRKGLYPPPPGASELPGLEVAGTVVAANAAETAVGTPVCALVSGGGYAEYCVAPAAQCLPVPNGLSLPEAAAVPETYFTVWSNIFDRGQLRENETLLVHGGASGIGTTAIQLASALGSTVFATAGSNAKTALCEQLGAKLAINYREQNFRELISAHGGADVILDIVGATYLEDNLKLLNPEGRLVIIAVLGGAKATVNLASILLKRLTLTGSTLRSREPEFKAAIAKKLQQHVWPLLEQGIAKPVIQRCLPMNEAATAHEILEAEQAMGKLVLVMDPELMEQMA
ncbi:MAG: NAD(P)H-quinone oxidoreductase [Gammaproteobacteria bacterium]